MSGPVEPERGRFPWRELFGWRFWVNYAVCLVVTVWVPLAELTTMVNGVQQGEPRRLPMYEVYRQVWESPSVPAGWKFVAAHWGITFVVMAAVWGMVLWRSGQHTAGQSDKSDERDLSDHT